MEKEKSFWLCLTKHRFFLLFLAFAIPFTLRTVPEILAGPYIIGFDTMGFYVPNTLSWFHDGVNLWSYLSVAPLFYLILMSLVSSGMAIIVALKILPPLLCGALGLSIYFYALKGLNWSPKKSLIPAVLGTVYFVALRISWDMLRNELGLIFLFVFMTLIQLKKYSSLKDYAFISLSMVLVVLSHQLVSVVLFVIATSNIIYLLIKKQHSMSTNLVLSALPAAIVFVLSYFTSSAIVGYQTYSTDSPMLTWLGFPNYPSMLLAEGGFFVYCFLPLLPLAFVSLKRFKNFNLQIWVILSVTLLLVPGSFVSPFRWLLLLTYPFAFYTTEALSILKSSGCNRFKVNVYKVAVVYLVLSTAIFSIGYVLMPPEKPFVYFNPRVINNYSGQIPASMLQNTISITDFQDTTKTLQYFRDNITNNSVLLTHNAFYSWALLTLDESDVENYEFQDPSNAALNAAREGCQTYAIWWVDGQGWYNQPSLPSSFHEIYHSGRIGLYSYQVS